MIKFFRKIRQNLLMENKTGKYFKYAIGEIILVVIGILIALQINNLNDERLNSTKEYTFLNELSKSIESDIVYFQKQDSIRTAYEANSEKAILMFYDAKNYNDLLLVDSLFTFQWSDWEISRSVYEEMLNTGSLYTLKNDKLKDRIANYYTLIESRVYALKKINDVSIKLSENTVLYQLELLRNSNGAYNGKLKDAWIGDPNSSEFMLLYKFYRFTNLNCNTYRRMFGAQILKRGNELLEELNNELNLSK